MHPPVTAVNTRYQMHAGHVDKSASGSPGAAVFPPLPAPAGLCILTGASKGDDVALILLLLVSNASETPEGFLVQLTLADPDFWVETRLGNNPRPDSIRTFLEGVSNLTVIPGPRVLEQTEGGYRVVFPECRWGFRRAGRIHALSDTTCVVWTPEGFRWSRIPLFNEQNEGLDPMKGVCGGLILSGVILGLAVMFLVSARRRYRG